MRGAKMSTKDPATAENPPSEISAGDTKREKGPSPETEAAAGVGGTDTAETPTSESSTSTGDVKREKGPSPETEAAAGVGGSDD
jgi:hypothetical protein